MLFKEIADELSRRGNNVKIIASNRTSTDDLINPKPKTVNKRTDKDIVYLPVLAKGRKFFRLGELFFGNSIFTCFKKGPVFLNLWPFIKNQNIDWVVSGLFPLANTFWGYLASKLSGAKLAVIPAFHESDREHQNPFLFRITRKADLVIALSKNEKKELIKHGILEKNIIVSAGIVNQAIFINPKNRVNFPKTANVLFLGVKSAHKNIITLIEAMKIIWKSMPEVSLTIAGPETLYSPKIKKIISLLPKDIQKNVKYLGKVSEKQKVDLIDRSTLLVNPSCQESFGIVFTEAWARKKPVIGAKTPVTSEVIINQKDGLLAKPDDATDLAKKVKNMIDNQEVAKRMGERGYKKAVDNFTSEKVVGKILKSISKK